MRKFLAAALVALVAVAMFAMFAGAAPTGYHYVWKQVTWSSDTTAFYIPSGASAAIKNSDIISLPMNTYWCTPADSVAQVLMTGTISAAGAATDTLMLGVQFTYDGTNYIPALDWDIDDQVHVGAGLYFSYRLLAQTGGVIADQAAGAGRYAAGVPNTYAFQTIAKGARGMRIVIHPSHAARTLNGKLSMMIGIPVQSE